MGLFDEAGLKSAQEMHALADDAMGKADKLLDKADNVVHSVQVRLDGLIHGVLDRFRKCIIHIEISPAKAEAVNPPPD